MTVNVVELIKKIGKNHQQLVDGNVIAYKTPPKAPSGSPVMSLDMAKEGIFLAFKRDGKILNEVTLYLQKDGDACWDFPNELPKPFEKKMTRSWVHEHIGEPSRSSAPKVVMKREFGWFDLYENKSGPLAVSYQIDYDVMDNAKQITFMPTSELRW
jgi:hypothetical protein